MIRMGKAISIRRGEGLDKDKVEAGQSIQCTLSSGRVIHILRTPGPLMTKFTLRPSTHSG